MGSIRVRKGSNTLFFDFRYQGRRCREQTTLADTAVNRKKMQHVMEKIEAEITLGSFNYRNYFPNSPLVEIFENGAEVASLRTCSPLFEEVAWQWFGHNQVRWKRSMEYTVKCTLRKYLVPAFKDRPIADISRSDILSFRATLAESKNGKRISNDRINHIMTPLRQIFKEAAHQYQFNTPFIDIEPLRIRHSDVDPFTLEEVWKIINNVRPDFRNGSSPNQVGRLA